MERFEDPVNENPSDRLNWQRRIGEETLDLVRRTFQTMEAAADRAQALADTAQANAQAAVNELTIAEERIKLLEEELRLVEARACEAEGWLDRVHEGLHRNLADGLAHGSLSPTRSPRAA
jgi:hypothetical protein